MFSNQSKLLLLFLLIVNIGVNAQSNNEVEKLLLTIGKETKNSKAIISNKSAQKIMDYDIKVIPFLIHFFSNQVKTKTYSECQERNLTIGEIAIILVDRIEMMPYHTVTGIQNCMLSFCEDNENLIEYYFRWNDDKSLLEFIRKYKVWFSSKERESRLKSN